MTSDLLTIVLGSHSRPKLQALTDAACSVYGDTARVYGADADSHVSPHPTNPHESRVGALNRAHGAKFVMPNADVWIGIEGGMEEVKIPSLVGTEPSRWHEYGFVYAMDRLGNVATGRTSGIRVPDHFLPIILGGGTLNDAVEAFHGIKNIGDYDGATGLLTNGALTRRSLYANGIIEALSELRHQHLYRAPA